MVKTISSKARQRSQQLTTQANSATVPLVKICGITSAEDAKLAVDGGADMIGEWSLLSLAISLSVIQHSSCSNIAVDMCRNLRSQGIWRWLESQMDQYAFAGMIMWQGAKRAVDAKTSAAIAAVARDGGAVAVGVFVDESFDQIIHRCELAGISTAQLHGDGARASLQLLPSTLEVSYNGGLQT